MNKNILFGAVGVVVAVGIIGLYATSKSPTTGLGNEGSLKNLLAFQGSQKCTFDSQSGLAGSTGEVYVSHGKMRGDFTSLVQGQTIKSHMVINDDTSYIWTDALQQGFKLPLEAMTATGTAQSQGVDFNQSLKYSCNSWTEDATLLTPPIDVTFNDMSDMMNKVMPKSDTSVTIKTGSTASSLQAQCGACDQAPNATIKAQCRAVLGCK